MTEATPTTTDTETDPQALAETRAKDGKFLPGVSGNPKGRPKGKKNQITELKQDMEIAIRENLSPDAIKAVVASMLAAALDGNVGAGKLILDKVMSNARDADDAQDSSGGLKIIIENATMDVLQNNQNVIDVTAEEISDE